MISFSYRTSKSKILRSVKGPSPNESLQTPVTLLQSIKLIYFSLLLVVFDNFITHFIAIFSEREAYFSVGASSIIIFPFFATFIYGISFFFDEIIRIPSNIKSNFVKYVFKLKYIFIFVFLIFLILSIANFEITVISNYVVLFTGLLIFSFIVEMYLINNTKITNSVDKLRIYLSGAISLGLMILFFIGFSFLPTSGPSETWPTRTIYVELLIFTTDLWALFTAAIIHLIILLPRKLRILFGIEDEEFFLFRDEKMDYDWSASYWTNINSYKRQENTDLPQASGISDYVIITDIPQDSRNRSGILELSKKFGCSEVYSLGICKEKYFNNYILRKSNVLFLVSDTNTQVSKFINIIHKEYEIKLSMEGVLKVNNFEYSLENYDFTSINVVPAYWDFSKKIWLLMSSKHNYDQLIKFASKYYNFYDEISNQEPIFSVQKFELDENNKLISIPSDPSNSSIPDSRHLIFL